MNPELPSVEQDGMVSPHAREVEYALILSRMIDIVKGDPSQIRLAIYEFARARLKLDTSWADEAERKQLSAALEAAIQGVEQFSVRQDEQQRLRPSAPSVQIGPGTLPTEAAPAPELHILRVSSPPDDIPAGRETYWRAEGLPVVQVQTRARAWRLARFSIGILLFGAVAGLAIYEQRTAMLRASLLSVLMVPSSVATPSNPEPSQQTSVTADVKTAAVSSTPLPFPLPSDYGVYALANAELIELQLLSEQLPDKRVAISTPINQPSRTSLPDGKAKFLVFRRDLAGNALDRIEVRVVARVARALVFDSKGKPSSAPVDAWNIRNLSYEFKVRPVTAHPEMLLVQPKDPDFTLPAGRYILALKNQGYDFTVAGKVTDPSQCLERTDAANGSFYTDCQKQ
jgi:hypothetical protein